MRPREVNRLIAVCGPPCSGKTTLARVLANQLGFIHLEVDRIRALILPDSKSSEGDRDAAYAAMHQMTEFLLNSQAGVIVDATYGRTERMADLRDLSRRAEAPLVLVQCKISPDLAVERFRARSGPHFALDLDEDRVVRLVEAYPDHDDAFGVDATLPLDQFIEPLIARINQGN